MNPQSIKKNVTGGVISVVIALALFMFYRSVLTAGIGLVVAFIVYKILINIRVYFAVTARIKRIEEVFPDFLQLMSSNLRAGMTIDRAILFSSRPEFSPLDEEILKTGKDITLGKSMERALLDMARRINSAKINKIALLINSGIRSGGDLAALLDETARGIRDRAILEKKAASNVLMYVIFIFLAISIFAPALFSLSNILVGILTEIFSSLPDIPQANVNLPFNLSKINVSTTFIFYFSIIFIITIDILASLILGLVSKGEEKQGLTFLPILIVVSVGVFFLVKLVVGNFVGSLF
ncbi:MAG: hypothetical protein RL557_1077 [archaeon]|jgi:archaellum biogenesis protein FlaJ (TadC family)